MLMDLVKKDKESGMGEPPVWATYQKLIDASAEENFSESTQKVVRFFEDLFN